MRALLTLVLVFLIPAAAGCGDALGPDDESTRGLPSAAVSAESLDTTWAFSLREVGTQRPLVETAAHAMVSDGILEFATDDGSAGAVFSIENIDPRATACHPNGIILDDACMDRGAFPYLIFDRAPVLEVYLNGRACVVPRDGSANQIMADSDHTLYTVRAIAPVICPGGDEYVFEVELERVDAGDAFGEDRKPELGGSNDGAPILIGD